jgi:hypothetical protein
MLKKIASRDDGLPRPQYNGDDGLLRPDEEFEDEDDKKNKGKE